MELGRLLLLVGLGLLAAGFLVRWVMHLRTHPDRPGVVGTAIGFVTNFFDTLGIGSFAPTTSAFKLLKVTEDDEIPGTMHVGHTPPVIMQAFLFIEAVSVELTTLVVMIAAAVIGAWFGAGYVATWPRRRIQIGMGIALLIAAGTFLLAIFDIAAVGGDALGLGPGALVLAASANLILGALMTLGIGMYAPSMILISLLGMNPLVAFPIMMGASAFLMPVAGVRFMKARRFNGRAALGLALGGLPAVLVAFFIVQSLSLQVLRWLVVVVVTYAAVAMLRSAAPERS